MLRCMTLKVPYGVCQELKNTHLIPTDFNNTYQRQQKTIDSAASPGFRDGKQSRHAIHPYCRCFNKRSNMH